MELYEGKRVRHRDKVYVFGYVSQDGLAVCHEVGAPNTQDSVAVPLNELTSVPLAEVRSSCGRLVLFVADIAVAMEGDKCRHMVPEEFAERIPPEELELASIGGQSCKDMPLELVRFFRGDNWRSTSLEWAAKQINEAAGIPSDQEVRWTTAGGLHQTRSRSKAGSSSRVSQLQETDDYLGT